VIYLLNIPVVSLHQLKGAWKSCAADTGVFIKHQKLGKINPFIVLVAALRISWILLDYLYRTKYLTCILLLHF